MNRFFSYVSVLTITLCTLPLNISYVQAANKNSNATPAQSAAKDLLQMSEQIKDLNYTIYFSVYNSNGYEAYKFNNYFVNDIRYAELSNLEGTPYNVYLKGNLIGNASYGLRGTTFNILPNIFNADFSILAQNYIIAETGETRVADKEAYVYDITNKYSNLYSYRIALDKDTKLPLKADLLYRDLVSNSYTILNSYTAIYLQLGMDQQSLDRIKGAVINTNSVFSSDIDKSLSREFEKIVKLQFLPPGFRLISNNEVTMQGSSLINTPDSNDKNDTLMLAQTYGDGLFSFTIYVSKDKVNTNDHYYWQQADTTLYAEDYGNHKLIIVGQIPLSLAKGIINSISIPSAPMSSSHPNGFGQQLNIK
ncbi:MucB/RseB C-terminal domain-containing protein [Psittacicella gerlachiana]|uniref:Uncharacterized protein n=1 Tax=Psittacicella gerlachiana TaxID=2028574 RepID=A0A3A1Y703_9GAMM|nr:MucB/RseB C-terminal domain-containing protein [Psittacicella gerlachiana]RIY31834.1 hypothetical protein CKF59_07355 [Psittacicella gerlachiana]